MTEAEGFRTERDIDRRRFGQFLRLVVKLFLIVFTLAALLSPPDPISFTLLLVPGWVLAIPVAYYLIYRGGYAALRASPWYNPGSLAGRTTVWFAGTAFGLKIALTLLYEFAIPLAQTPATGPAISILSLGLAYVLVYQGGWDRLLRT